MIHIYIYIPPRGLCLAFLLAMVISLSPNELRSMKGLLSFFFPFLLNIMIRSSLVFSIKKQHWSSSS
ncbi:hypothetical protein SORBI_3004G223700 [Sorghum bicolor]|uniref:Uncharacterized protein n=1 Tax=Sorghum bicolor TaxID=4558 RepID=A0A194YR67_SORBI|nr:hypothetical protein SORBI_3004G223700 [Sorghum bicolor]